MAASEYTLDASNVATRLWVGSRPPFDSDIQQFDVLTLCAAELQPSSVAFHGMLLRCPIRDDILTDQEVTDAVLTSRSIAQALRSRRRVLVTCSAGLNRSALVASLALAQITRMSAEELIRTMRERRNPNALYNKSFQTLLYRLVGSGRR